MDSIPFTADKAVARNYPYNCWWVAAYREEVGRSLLSRWLLDTPVLLYRTGAGDVVAMEDRCPHRQAPLSLGVLRDDEIECGYHGFRFGASGRCTHVPTMAGPPPISVETYPVRECGPFVWIYLGDQQRIDDVPPPYDIGWPADPSFGVRSGHIEVAANYMLLKENVLDLSHLGFVHAKSFGITDLTSPPQVTTEDETVTYCQRFTEKPLPAGYALALGMEPGVIWNRETYGSFVSPALQISSVDFRDPAKPDSEPMGRIRFCHATTPIDRTRMHYFYMLGRDHARDDDAMDIFAKVIKIGFAEDQAVLEAIQNFANRSPRRGSSGERSVKADAAGVHARRAIDRWMARETIPTDAS